MKAFAATLVLLLVPTIAAADPKEERSDRADPNRVVCRTEGVTGSRLGARKRCLTAREWNEITFADRQSIERTQMNRYNGNQGGSVAVDPFGRMN